MTETKNGISDKIAAISKITINGILVIVLVGAFFLIKDEFSSNRTVIDNNTQAFTEFTVVMERQIEQSDRLFGQVLKASIKK